MANALSRLRRDERGMALVWTAVGFLAFFSASALAIDVGQMMVARTSAQTAADAGALAGATALAFNDFNNRSASGPAVSSAVSTAQSNLVIAKAPSVLASDVTFPLNPVSGQYDLVQVSVYRTAMRGNPLATFIAGVFGVTAVDISAVATAEAAPANAETCVMPFTIPDKWIEKVDGKCAPDGSWQTTSSFNIAASKGNSQNSGTACSTPDVYIAPGSASATGYTYANTGMQLVLKNNNQSNVAPSMYNPWDLPGSTGGADYSNNIANCNTAIVPIGAYMTPENGNMVGPTTQGTDLLIAKDPGAVWDTSCNCVKGSAFGLSPRVAIVPLYNPDVYAQGQQSGKSQPALQVANYLGFFIEGVDGSGNVTGRITPVGGLITGNGGPATGAFPRAIQLVK